jgi:uncharacterized membrane protein (DUF4010 family)
MALLFQVALMAITAAEEAFGRQGVVASGALFGLTDLDALTVSMSQLAENPDRRPLAALGIAVGVLSNTVFKLGVSLALGSGPFRRAIATRMLAMGAAVGAGIWLGSLF